MDSRKMQILKPVVHETVWGGSKLTPFSYSKCQKIGHLYSTVDTSGMRNSIIAGSYKGKNLHTWFEDNKKTFGLERYLEFPVITALVEAADNLSVQVHPDDEMAFALENKPFGKNESFYILQPPKSGKLINGSRAKTVEEFCSLLKTGRCLEAVDHVEVKAHDYVYVVGGTVHAATAGSLSFEIEENCDATYRFYDYDRFDSNGKKRPLQIEQALACLRPQQKSEIKRYEPGQWIEERKYATRPSVIGERVSAQKGELVFAVLLSGRAELMSEELLPGAAVILEDSDVLDVSQNQWMLIKL